MPTVDRVLPWRRNHPPPADEVAPLLNAFRRRHPKAPTALITRAYLRSADAHRGQSRNSGEPYVHHPLAVAKIVADFGLDDVTVAAALLHDTVEDTGTTLDEIERAFGADVAAIVDGVTKLERVQFDSQEAQQAATMRKMLVAMARDLRVLIIKLADRLHNMRTIAAMPAWKQDRIARETLDIYAPLAHRLGMQDVKTAARGPRLRRTAPQALRRDRPHDLGAHARARHLPHPGARGGAPAPGRAAHHRRGHRAAQAPVLASTRRWS